ncbi:hypothetical protein KAZ92_01215 [Candidatus Gracilibacteria bacterium]|nr:hypothetical protein [Candidatus Gracilibacteria bacterium]
MADEQNIQTVQLVEDVKPSATPAQNKSVPLMNLESDNAEEELSWFGKLVNFFKSTVGKILIFTVLFLGISGYIVYSSNTVLFKGSAGVDPTDLIRQTVDQQITRAQIPTATDPINNKANPFIGSNAIPTPGASPTIDTSFANPLLTPSVSQLSQSQLDAIKSLSNLNTIGNQIPGATQEVTGTVTPDMPTALTAVCSSDNTKTTLRWMPVKNVSPVAYELYVYDLSNKGKIDALPFSPKPNLTTTVYDFQPKPGQEYMWRVIATSGGLRSAQADGKNFTCGTKPLLINPNQVIDPNCGDNQYYVPDSDPTKSGCKNIPSYVGGASQSDLICGLYSTILADPVGYKLNDVTKKTLNAGVASQCKNGQAQVQSICPTGKFGADCSSVVPSVTGLSVDAAKSTCTHLQNMYNDATALKMNSTTMADILQTLNGPTCKPAGTQTNTNTNAAKICPAGQYPVTADVPGSCQSLPNFNLLKNKDEFISACTLYKSILSAGKDAYMDPKTVQDIANAANGIVCGEQFFSGSGNVTGGTVADDQTSGGAVTGDGAASDNQVAGQTSGQTGNVNGSKFQPMQSQDTGNIVPVHPVAGKNTPHKSASTGPEMWIYSIGAAVSYFSTRKKKTNKK